MPELYGINRPYPSPWLRILLHNVLIVYIVIIILHPQRDIVDLREEGKQPFYGKLQLGIKGDINIVGTYADPSGEDIVSEHHHGDKGERLCNDAADA